MEAFASPGAELVYVGKRGLQKSFKQSQIDGLLVQWCLKASAASPPPPPLDHLPSVSPRLTQNPASSAARAPLEFCQRSMPQLHCMHPLSLQGSHLTMCFRCRHCRQGCS